MIQRNNKEMSRYSISVIKFVIIFHFISCVLTQADDIQKTKSIISQNSSDVNTHSSVIPPEDELINSTITTKSNTKDHSTTNNYIGSKQLNKSNSSTPSYSNTFSEVTLPVPNNLSSSISKLYGIGDWNITDHKKNMCIRIKGNIVILLEKNNVTKNESITSEAKANGDCDAQVISLVLEPKNLTLTFKFAKNATYFWINEVSGNINDTKFKNTSLQAFLTPLNRSYSCATDKEVVVSKIATVKLNSFQIQAFKKQGFEFDSAIDCNGFVTPDIVPIILVCALGLLIVGILIGILINRKMRHAQGYLSM